MKKILVVAAALVMVSSVASAGTITFEGGGKAVNMDYTTTDIGGGLTRYDVFLDDPTNALGSYFLQLLGFSGNINQDAAGSKNTLRVNDDFNAGENDGNNYDPTVDSYFFGPFAPDNLASPAVGVSGIQDIAIGANPAVAGNVANLPEGVLPRQFVINAGSGGGSTVDNLQIAQIVASGNVTVSGNVARSGASGVLSIVGSPVMTSVIPEPSSFVLLGMGAVALAVMARRRKTAA